MSLSNIHNAHYKSFFGREGGKEKGIGTVRKLNRLAESSIIGVKRAALFLGVAVITSCAMVWVFGLCIW